MKALSIRINVPFLHKPRNDTSMAGSSYESTIL